MTRRRPRLFDPERGHTPRGVTSAEAGWEIGLSENRFGELLPRLQEAGFPLPDPLTHRYDLAAIHGWLDARSGLSNPAGSREEELDRNLEAFANGEDPRAASG